jgi:hypothetical protein
MYENVGIGSCSRTPNGYRASKRQKRLGSELQVSFFAEKATAELLRGR